MGTFIIRRLLTAIPTLIAISIIVFSILKLAPGDPMSQFAANPAVPPEVRENIARQLGLPTDPNQLGALAPRNNAKLAAALVRVSLDDDLRDKVSPQR